MFSLRPKLWSILSVSPGGEQALNVTVTLPYIADNTYYIQAVADHADSVVESNEGNNTKVGGQMAVSYGPDLFISQLAPPPSATSGQQTTIPVTVKNQGIGTSESNYLYLYYSTDPTFATRTYLPGSSRIVSTLPPRRCAVLERHRDHALPSGR